MLSATPPSISSHAVHSTTASDHSGLSQPLILRPQFFSNDLWLQIRAKKNGHTVAVRYTSVKVTSRIHPTALRNRELMRLNQEPRPEPFRPPGIPSNVPVGITNILPINLPSHPNAPMPTYVLVPSASGDSTKIGDCPFSQRVLMTLEEKYLPYEGWFIDIEDKPAWFSEINTDGKLPAMLVDGNWVSDADVITEILEKRIPLPAMRTPQEKVAVGLKIFPLFVRFLRSKDSSSGSEKALLAELESLNEHLKKEDAIHKNPFVTGRFPSMLDMDLAPKLYHMDVALKHFKNWSLPEDLIYLDAYIKKMFARSSFTKTKCPEEVVMCGWEKHLSSIGQ